MKKNTCRIKVRFVVMMWGGGGANAESLAGLSVCFGKGLIIAASAHWHYIWEVGNVVRQMSVMSAVSSSSGSCWSACIIMFYQFNLLGLVNLR